MAGTLQAFPSVRYGLEMAVLNLIANSKQCTLGQLISKSEHTHVPVCGLVSSYNTGMAKEVKAMVEQGFRAIKLKIGQGSIADDIRAVRAVGDIIENKALLRLDANQSWDINKAVAFWERIGCAAVEYIEEPFADAAKFEEFL